MTEAIFPSLAGLAWSVMKRPMFSTRTQTSVSRRESRLADQLYPIWEWTLNYDVLRDAHDIRASGLGTGFDELRTLAGFWLQRQGAFGTFLFEDPTDSSTTAETLGTGDGARTTFQLLRTFGGFAEPIAAPKNITEVRDNGTPVTPVTGWTVDSLTGIVTFATAPAAGHVIAADFTYYFRCRFSDDGADFENFMFQLWQVRQLKLRSVLQ